MSFFSTEGLESVPFPSTGTHSVNQYREGDKKYFVKFPTPISFSEYSPDLQIIVEHLAYEIYQAFGIKVPKSYLVIHPDKNTLGIATDNIQGKIAGSPLPLLGHNDINMGFFVDVFLANWDVMGLMYDNVIIQDDGQVYRIDPGGSLTYRARGGRKGNTFGENPNELETFRDAELSSQAGNVFSKMSKEQMLQAARVFESVLWEKIEDIISYVKQEVTNRTAEMNPMKGQKILNEVNQEFNEILTKLRIRYKKIIEFISKMEQTQ